jgi:hypothetical protein
MSEVNPSVTSSSRYWRIGEHVFFSVTNVAPGMISIRAGRVAIQDKSRFRLPIFVFSFQCRIGQVCVGVWVGLDWLNWISVNTIN